jgi:hypothetical protein
MVRRFRFGFKAHPSAEADACQTEIRYNECAKVVPEAKNILLAGALVQPNFIGDNAKIGKLGNAKRR